MLAKLKTYSLLGIDAVPVEVEVDVSPAGLPKTILVGLPEAAVKESTHRVERAIVNSGFQRPQNRVVINLAPADLPIALGILAGSAAEAAVVEGVDVIPVSSLAQAVSFLSDGWHWRLASAHSAPLAARWRARATTSRPGLQRSFSLKGTGETPVPPGRGWRREGPSARREEAGIGTLACREDVP